MPGPVDELIRWATLAAGPTGVADRDLLERFVAGRDQAAFAELVRRYGPVVFGVCQRVIGHRQDAEDAFQATFLVLARKADRIGRPDALGGWLYAVAVRVARKARRVADRRRGRETPVHPLPDAPVLAVERCPELAGVIDEELAALPAWYRDAVVLCDLRGQSRTEAAGALGIPEGTLSSRLSTGRKKLAVRLARRGVEVPAAGLAATLGTDVIAVAPRLVASAADAALAGSAGGAVAAKIQFLAAEWGWGVGKVKLLTAAVVATGVGVGTVAGWSGEKPGDEPAKPAAPPAPKVEPAAKAEVPAEKPSIPGRPRLLRTAEVAGSVSAPVWSPDGRFLAATSKINVRVFDATNLTVHGPTFEDRFAIHVVGSARTAGGPAVAIVGTTRGSINLLAKLYFIPFDGGNVFDERTRTVPFDPIDGTPVALLPDGKTVLTIESPKGRVARRDRSVPPSQRTRIPTAPETEPVETIFRLLDTAAENAEPRVVRVAGDAYGWAVLAGGGRLVVAVAAPGGGAVRCLSLPDGRVVWERPLPDTTVNVSASYGWDHGLAASPDGTTVAVLAIRQLPGDSSGRAVGEVVVLDAATGEQRAKLQGIENDATFPYSLSNDGRLVVGGCRVSSATTSQRTVIWDTTTGKELKSWEGSATAAFSPTQPILAVIERVTERSRANPSGATQTEVGSVIGLWDVSSLVK